MHCGKPMAGSEPCGLILLDKPSGPTSHDLVDEVRRLLGTARVGHTGTLDPMASGLLLILVGRATKLQSHVPGDPKIYQGTMVLGVSTDTMDAEGRVISFIPYEGDESEAERAVASLVGEREQVPPMYSAAKYRGKPLYYYARRGREVARKGKRIRVYRAEMTSFRRKGEAAEVDFTLSCSPGTYIREIAFYLGRMLGCGGSLARLRRVASGPFVVEEAMTPQALRSRVLAGEEVVLPPLQALRGYPCVELRREYEKTARNGASLNFGMCWDFREDFAAGEKAAVVVGEELIGIYERAGENTRFLRPKRLL